MTTTETLTNMKLASSPVKYEVEPEPMPVRPVSSRPARTPSRASFAEEQAVSPVKGRPKTSHVSGRRRWGGSPPPHPKVEESPEEDLPHAPDSPTLRPMTNIYRFVPF